MTKALRRFPKYFLITIAAVTAAFGQTLADSKDLPNFHEVNSKLYRGGQPNENGIKRLGQMGVKTIIDLRGDDELAKKEEQWAKSSDIKFITASLSNWFKPKDAEIEEIISLIGDPENQPVFVHCRRGSDRTGTVIAVYRMTHDGWTDEQSIKEAKQFGLGWWQFWMKDYINDYYEKLRLRDNRSDDQPHAQLKQILPFDEQAHL